MVAPAETAVNGFGRIGMLYTRSAIDRHPEDLAVAGINTGERLNAHDVADRLAFDSIHRNFDGHEVDYDDGHVFVDGQPIRLLAAATADRLDWSEVAGEDLIVVESTGSCLTTEAAKRHIESGARFVVITAPAKDQEIVTIVRGVNDTEETLASVDEVVSVSSCSTNCLAPILRVLDGSLTMRWAKADVVHAYTNSQRVLDGRGTDLVSRRNLDNILPASTGSSIEVQRLFPDVPFHANSLRVPVSDGSVAILNAEVEGRVTAETLAELFVEASHSELRNIIGINESDMFSSRVIDQSYSAVIDISRIIARSFGGRTIIELQAWFDNEWGYANRVAEVAKLLTRSL